MDGWKDSDGDRGLREFSLVDTRGQKVTVRTSSSASEPCVWVFCKDHEGAGVTHHHLHGHSAVTPHLNSKQAVALARALNEWGRSVIDSDPETAWDQGYRQGVAEVRESVTRALAEALKPFD